MITNHAELADALWLIAAVLFAVAGLLLITQRPDPSRGSLIAFGLAVVAVAWLVL